MKKIFQNNPECLKDAFKFFDKDKDGIISLEDIKNTLSEWDNEYNSVKNLEAYTHIFEEADSNSDEKIDYFEFYRLFSLRGK